MKRKILFFTLLLALIACVFAISTSAAVASVDGVYYDFNDTSLTAAIDSSNQSKCTLSTVVIPEKVSYNDTEYKVTSIEENAFNGNKSITAIVIYPKLSAIPNCTFQGATNLKKLYIDLSEVTTIGTRGLTLAGSNDASLASGVGFYFYTPESYTAGDESTDVRVTEITLNKVTSIGAAAFNSAQINKITIGSSCTSVGVQTFRHSTLAEIDTGASLVPDYFCGSNASLEKITIRNATTIGSNCFAGCTKVAEIYIDMSNVTSVGGYAFVMASKYDAGNTTTRWYNLDGDPVVDLSNVTKIYGQAFASSNLGANGATTIIWPKALTVFNDECFRKCNITGPLFLNASESANLTAHYWALEGNSFDMAIFGTGFKTLDANLTSATVVVALAETVNIKRSSFMSASGNKTLYCGEITGYSSFSNTTIVPILGGTALHTSTCGYGAKVTYPNVTYEVIGNFSHTESPNGVATTPSCTTPTGTEYFCSLCALPVRYEITEEAIGHDFSILISSTALSCLIDQTETHQCSRCDATYLTTITEATGHSYDVSYPVEATLGSDGTKKYVCINFDGTCGDTHEVSYRYAPDDLDVKIIMKTGEEYTLKAKDIFNITVTDTVSVFERHLSSVKGSFTVNGVTLSRNNVKYISVPYGFTHASKNFSSSISTIDFTDAGDIILQSTFQDNSSVTEVILGTGNVLKNDVFRCMANLSIVRIADGATVVFSSSYDVFQDTRHLDQIIIGKNANVRFERNNLINYGGSSQVRLSSITIGDGATVYFGYNCFGLKPNSTITQTNLTEINFGVGNYTFGEYCFQGSALQNLSIPQGSSVAFEGTKALLNCTALESVFLPSSATFIPNETFSGCTSLEAVVLMGVTSIGDNVFKATTDNTLTIFSHSTGDLTISASAFTDRANVILYTPSANVTSITATAYTIYTGIPHAQYEAQLDPTCTVEGYDGYATDCPCGAIVSEVTFDIYSSSAEATTGSYGVHTIIPNLGGHTNKIVIVYANGFDKAGEKSTVCSVCKELLVEATEVNAIFTHVGYSYKLNGEVTGIHSGFEVDQDALSAYEKANETTLTFGMIIANPKYLGDAFLNGGDVTAESGAIQVAIDIGNYTTFSCHISGFQKSEALASLELVIAGYVYEGNNKAGTKLMQKSYEVGEDAPVVSKVTKTDATLYTVTITNVKANVALPAQIKEYGTQVTE